MDNTIMVTKEIKINDIETKITIKRLIRDKLDKEIKDLEILLKLKSPEINK